MKRLQGAGGARRRQKVAECKSRAIGGVAWASGPASRRHINLWLFRLSSVFLRRGPRAVRGVRAQLARVGAEGAERWLSGNPIIAKPELPGHSRRADHCGGRRSAARGGVRGRGTTVGVLHLPGMGSPNGMLRMLLVTTRGAPSAEISGQIFH